MHGRNAERGAKAVQQIENADGKARFIAADLSDADDVRGLAAEAGQVDILVDNAGIYEFGSTFVARAVAFIASPAASYVNGAVLPVDGGAVALRPAA